jgi:hypothetical protein
MNEVIGTTPEEIMIISVIIKIFSVMSIVSTLVIIFIYCYFKSQRTFYHELILWFSITNGLYSATSFIPFDGEKIDAWCGLQAFSINMFQSAGYIWSALIGYTGFITVIKRDHFEKNRFLYRIIFLLIAYFISAATSAM